MIEQALALAMQSALPLVVVAPVVGAAAAAAIQHRGASWAVALSAAAVAAALAIFFSWRALVIGAPPQQGGALMSLSADGVAPFLVAVLAVASALVIFAAGGLLKAFSGAVAGLVIALALCVGAGWSGALLARDFVGLVLGVEIGWFAGLCLVLSSGERDKGAISGALRMLSAGGAASALMFLGVGMIGRGVGSFEIEALESARILAPGLAAIGVALTLAALAVKAAIAPLHLWTGAALGRADPLTAWVLGVVGLAGALAVLMRLSIHALGAPALGDGMALALATLGAASVVIGSMQAIGARNLVRLVTYAGAAQAGCILMSVALGSQAGIAAALIQWLALAASALALLGGAAAAGGAHAMHLLDGLGRRAPLAGVAVTAGALGLMGAPLTIAFLGRWRMIEAAVGAGWWWAAVTAIAASLAGVFYGGRLIERVYFRRANTAAEQVGLRLEFGPALLAAIVVIALGAEPSLLLRAANMAAAQMIGVPP